MNRPETFSLVELRDELKKRGLSPSGLKGVLLKRLKSALARDQRSATTSQNAAKRIKQKYTKKRKRVLETKTKTTGIHGIQSDCNCVNFAETRSKKRSKSTSVTEPQHDIEDCRTNFFAEARREVARLITRAVNDKEIKKLHSAILSLQRELQIKNNTITQLREAIYTKNDTIRALTSHSPIPTILIDQWTTAEKMRHTKM
jgi:hypothetical protein